MDSNSNLSRLKEAIGQLDPNLTITPLHRSTPDMLQIVLPGSRAQDVWRRLRTSVAPIGYWPVVLGDSKDAANLTAGLDFEIPPYESSQNAEDFFRKRIAQASEYGVPLEDMDGEWPTRMGDHELSFIVAHDLLSMKPKPEVHIGLFPTSAGWEIPVLLKYGGWNEYPTPLDNRLVMKYWNDKYGAVLATMSADVIEMMVDRPPTTRDAAMHLARQQFAYCSDVVLQGTQTLQALAAELLDNQKWFFWWD